MPLKKYTQSGIFSVMILLPILVLCVIMLFISGIDDPATVIIFSLVILIFIICLLIFYKMTIIIDDTHLTFTMGIGLVRKSYPLSDIESCRPVRNSPLYGVGIHLTPVGWLYNVSGKYAIEVSFKSNSKKIRIGTDRPEEIARTINNQIDHTLSGSYYDKGGHSGIYLIIALVSAAIILPLCLIIYGGRETDVTLSDVSLNLRGIYGLSINYTEITGIDTMRSLPAIRSRTNGLATGKVLKGHFKLQDQSKVLLFIKRGVPPYLCVKTKAATVYLNFLDPDRTREFYQLVNQKMK